MRHTQTSSSALERLHSIQTREPLDMSHLPAHDDNSRDSLRAGEYPLEEQRNRYGYIRMNRAPEEIVEGGFARHRADNNFANLSKFADLSDIPTGALIGAGVGGLAAGALMHSKMQGAGALTKLMMKAVPKKFVANIAGKRIATGMTVGGITGAAVGAAQGHKKDATDEAHAYITDVGVSVFPKRMGPADLSQSFHMEHPIAKYLPAVGTLALGGASALSDVSVGKNLNIPKLVALATIGGGVGTVARLLQENAYMKPYKKGYIKSVEDKYGRKMASDIPVQEYITETNIEVLPFHDTAPADLEAAYNFKYPLHSMAPALGTIMGVGGAIGGGMLRRKPIGLSNVMLAGTVGGVGASIVAQIRKDQALQAFRKPVVQAVHKKYTML